MKNQLIIIWIVCWISPLICMTSYRPVDGNWCHLDTGLVQLKLSSTSEEQDPFSSSQDLIERDHDVIQNTHPSHAKKHVIARTEKDHSQETDSSISRHHHSISDLHISERKDANIESEHQQQSSSKQVWVSVKRDGSVWVRLGWDRLADDWIHDSEKEKSYQGAVLKEQDIHLLSRLNYSDSCVLSDLDLNIFTLAAWQPSYLVAFDPVEKRNHIVTMKHHKDCSSKALIQISHDRQQLHCSYASQELSTGHGFGTIGHEDGDDDDDVIERGVCGQKLSTNKTLKMESIGTLFLRDFSFDPSGDESWRCKEGGDGWNSYRFFGSYYFAFVKVAECPRPTSSARLGYEPKLRPNWDVEINQAVVPDPTQTFLDDAVVVAWEVFVKMVSHQHSVYLQVWRPKFHNVDLKRPSHRTKLDKRFTTNYVLIGQTFFQPKTLLLHTLTLKDEEQIAVRKGDVLGFYHSHSNPLAFDFVPCAFFEQLSRWSKMNENFQRPMRPGEELSFQTFVISNKTSPETIRFPSNRSSDVFCRQYSFVAVLANTSNSVRTRTIDDWSCPDHHQPFHTRKIFSSTHHHNHPSSSLSNLHSNVVNIDRKHDEFRSQPSPLFRYHHHHHHYHHLVDYPSDANENYFTSVIVVIITSCLMVVMFCIGVASYLLATNCK